MPENRNNPAWEQHKNQDPQQNRGRGTKEEVSNPQKPENHLKDGTNDLQNGDQSSNLDEASEKSSTDKSSQG